MPKSPEISSVVHDGRREDVSPRQYAVREWVIVRQWDDRLNRNLCGHIPCIAVAVFGHQRVFAVERVIEADVALIVAL
jgi:hypothetical protein